MLEGIVRRLLVDRFGRFVHGVDDARLSSGLTSGQLLLSNLRLKEAAAEVLGLAPAFDLRHGTISRMRVDLPGITSFASKPVTIRIEDVFLLLVAAPSDADKVDVLMQAKSKARSKKLHEIETAMSSILLELSGRMAGKAGNESGGFLKSLIPITVILANLRIEIVNIHVRCEDDSATHPGYSFAFGITTQRIQLRAVNDSGQDIFISESVAVSRRKVDISNFAFYWDCDIHPESNPLWGLQTVVQDDDKTDDDGLADRMREAIALEESFANFDKIRRECFIVAPASAFCFLQINSNLQDFNTCRCSINFVVPKLFLHLRSKQFRDAKSIISYQMSMQKRIAAAEVLIRLQSRRPAVPQARAWWKYAQLSILELIRSRNDSSYGDIKSSNWKWETLQHIGHDRRQYLDLYAKCLRISDPKPKARRVKTDPKKTSDEPVEELPESMSPEEEASLRLLEDRLPVSFIVLLRSLVHQNRMVEQVIKEKVENKNAPGYFSWLFAAGAEGADADLSEDQKLAIRKEADIISHLETSTAPNDFELIRLDFQTNVICTLYDSHSNQEQRAIASSDINTAIQFSQYPHSTASKLLIKHLRISDLASSASEPLTVLSMYPSSEQSDTVLELFLETWTMRSSRNLDFNLKLNIETTKIVWSGLFFRQFMYFLHAGYCRNTLMLLDVAFWEWTEMQQSFLMSAFSKQRKHRIESNVGVVNVIFLADDSKNFAFAFRSFSVFSEPVSKSHDLYHAKLSNFQISIRASETEDAFVLLDPLTLETTLKISTRSLESSVIDISVPSVNISFDVNKLRILVTIITHFASTLSAALSRQQVSSTDPISSHSPVKKFALFPAVSLIIPSTNVSPKSQSISNMTGSGISFRCAVGILSITSVYCLRLASIEFSGTSSNWILHTDGVRLYNSGSYLYGWIAQSQDQHDGDKICITYERVSSKQSSIVLGMRRIDWQWSPFYIQSLMDFVSDASSVFSQLYVTPPSPSSKPVQSPIDWRYEIYLECCTCLFNKRHNRLALFNIVDASIWYLTSPYSIILKFHNSAVRDVSSASLTASTPTEILYADLVDMKISAGDPSRHWAAVDVTAIGCQIVYFHRQIQELCDYISNGISGIIFGFNPDKKESWPDFSPDLHGTFCAANVDFPNVEILIPACGTTSTVRRQEGLLLFSKNIHISNTAFADVDNFRTAEWKVAIDNLNNRSIFKTAISGLVTAKFSTDYRCPRIPWMSITVDLSSVELCLDDQPAIRSGKAALVQNLAEAWVQPAERPGEPEYHWYLDDILTETGSTIQVKLTLDSLILSSSLLHVGIKSPQLLVDRNSDWSVDLTLSCPELCVSSQAVDVVKPLPEGNAVCLAAPEQSKIRLISSLTFKLTSRVGSLSMSVALNSLELLRSRASQPDRNTHNYRLLFLKAKHDTVNEFRVLSDYTVCPPKTDFNIAIGDIYTYFCIEDVDAISTLGNSFVSAFPSSKSESSSALILSVQMELQSFSLSLSKKYGPVGENGTRDALFIMSFGLHPLHLTWRFPDGMEICSFNAVLQSDFLHPKVAVWEPFIEPFNLQFSWTRTGAQNILSNAQPLALEQSSASNLIANLMESNVKNIIQVLLNEPVRFNVSPDTVSSLVSLFVPNQATGIPSFVNTCAFTLRNFTGVPLKWNCNDVYGVVDDMSSASLECLGSNPWEPAHTLSLTVGDQWLAISNAYVGNVGAFQFALLPVPPGKDHRLPQDGLVLEALIENGHAVLSAHSSVGYFNCTSLQLRIVLFNGDAHHDIDLDPLQTRWAPLLYCAWDAFSIGVVEDGNSVRQLGRLSLSALRRKRRSEHVFCVGGSRYVFLCASSGGLWPGRLAITVRAPLDIRNRLPYPIEIKFDDGMAVCIDEGSKRQIETIDGRTDVQLRFTMQGFEWSNTIAVFAEKSQLNDGRQITTTVPLHDRFGAALYVVVEITRIIAVDDYESKLNGRALFRITFYTRLWLLNQVPNVELLFGSSKGTILPGQSGKQIIDYVYENQRWYPGKGWSAKLLPGDRPSWSDIDGRPATLGSEQLPGPEWAWVDSGWTVDTDPVESDENGWAYAKNFSKTFHAEHLKKYLVRRRRYSRARMLTNDSTALPICMFSPGGKKQLTSRYSTSHICVKTSKSDWSAPINLLHGTDTRVLTLFTHDCARILDLGIHISPARHPFRDTWVASFMPRYIVWNSFSESTSDVCVQQLSDSFNVCVVRPGKQQAFFFNRIPFETEKSVRATYVRVGAVCNGSMYWSSGFDINCIGLHVLRVSNSNASDDHRILQLQISMHRASVILYIGESDPARPRYSIRNELLTPVTISQLNSPANVYGKIEPNMAYTKFAWDFLSVKDRLLCLRIQDFRHSIDIDTIGAISKLSDSAFVSVYADGDTNVVLITPSEVRAKRVVQAYNDASSDSKPDCWLKISVHIEEAVISLISNARTELMLIALLSAEATLTRSARLQNFEVTLDALRIDNQLCLEHNSSFAFPNVIKSECSPSHSFIWFESIRSFHTSDMLYYKLFDLAVQPFIVNLEETYIVAVLEFIRSVQKAFVQDTEKQSFDALSLDPVSPSFGISKLIYFEVLRTPTIKMQLSVRKAQESLSHEYLRERIGLAHLLGVLLTNLEAKPIRRPGHEYLRLCDRASSLREQLLADYKGSLLLEFLASFGYNKLALGGVVPILSTFRAGVRDFRKEIQSSLKQGNIRGGLTRGTFSLIDHTARGLMMPITGLSAGFGDVISALTFDKDFTSRRALDVGNKPRHIVDGLIRGGRSFGMGLFNGVTALVREPIKHYHRHPGGVGIAVGLGKGVAQAVASPIVGVFDAINHLGTGIARTPDYFRRRSVLIHASVHFRLPRAFYGPGRSIRIYNAVDALIVDTLHSAKPPIDATIHHVFIGGLVNDVRAYALLIRGIAAFQISHDRYAAKLLWFIGWSSIKSFELIEHGIKIFSVSGADSKGPSWLLVWLSQPGAAYDMIMATHSRYKSALRVQSRRNLHIPIEDTSPVEVERNLSEST